MYQFELSEDTRDYLAHAHTHILTNPLTLWIVTVSGK